MSVQSRLGLPHRIDKVCLYRDPSLGGSPLFAVVSPDPHTGSFDAEVVDTAGNCYLSLRGYHTVAFSTVSDAPVLKALQAATA
jgi:hypothetical protein